MGMNGYKSSKLVKALSIGDSGTGKTGAVACLVRDGYRLRVADFDDGLRVLFYHLTPAERERVSVIRLADDMKMVKAQELPRGVPDAALRLGRALDNWVGDDGEELGPVSSWGQEDILMVDSLSFHARSCVRYAMKLRGWDKPRKPHPSEWHVGGLMQQALLERIKVELPCHFIGTAHIKLIGGDEDAKFDLTGGDDKMEDSPEARQELLPLRGYPLLVGRQISMQGAGYFDYTFRFETKPMGSNSRREIHTTGNGIVETKVPIPGIKKSLPQETGLSEIFKWVKDHG